MQRCDPALAPRRVSPSDVYWALPGLALRAPLKCRKRHTRLRTSLVGQDASCRCPHTTHYLVCICAAEVPCVPYTGWFSGHTATDGLFSFSRICLQSLPSQQAHPPAQCRAHKEGRSNSSLHVHARVRRGWCSGPAPPSDHAAPIKASTAVETSATCSENNHQATTATSIAKRSSSCIAAFGRRAPLDGASFTPR